MWVPLPVEGKGRSSRSFYVPQPILIGGELGISSSQTAYNDSHLEIFPSPTAHIEREKLDF